jgi:hypothetical protein
MSVFVLRDLLKIAGITVERGFVMNVETAFSCPTPSVNWEKPSIAKLSKTETNVKPVQMVIHSSLSFYI